MPAYGPHLTVVIAGRNGVPKNPATPSNLLTQKCVIAEWSPPSRRH
jgi:hypothetical protein